METVGDFVIKYWKRLGLGFVLIAVIFGLYLLVQARSFHVTGTSPSLSSISNQAPYIHIYLNRQLVTDSLEYTSQNDFVSNFEIDGNTLTFYMDDAMQADKEYTITIKSLNSNRGETIHNKQIHFTPKDIGFDKLPQDQRDYIVNRDSKKQAAYSVDSIGFDNFDALTDQGFTSDNLTLLEGMFFHYSNDILNQKFDDVDLDRDSLVVTIHDPTNGDSTDHANFNLKIDNVPYKAQLDYSFLNSVVMRLYDASGNQVFQTND